MFKFFDIFLCISLLSINKQLLETPYYQLNLLYHNLYGVYSLVTIYICNCSNSSLDKKPRIIVKYPVSVYNFVTSITSGGQLKFVYRYFENLLFDFKFCYV
jgi:hypothetical protein